MATLQRRVALNRPLFTQGNFESSALSVLTTFLHQFREPGRYEALIARAGRTIARVPVLVAGDRTQRQVNLDLARIDQDQEKSCCGCDGEGGQALAVGGVIGFHVSRGTARYAVTIIHFDDENRTKRIVLDSAQAIPEGDFFAITLVRPGVYRLATERGAAAEVQVRVPGHDTDYRPDRPVLLTLDREGRIEPSFLDIYSGQSVVIHCQTEARLAMELVKPDEDAGAPIGRARFTRRIIRRGRS